MLWVCVVSSVSTCKWHFRWRAHLTSLGKSQEDKYIISINYILLEKGYLVAFFTALLYSSFLFFLSILLFQKEALDQFFLDCPCLLCCLPQPISNPIIGRHRVAVAKVWSSSICPTWEHRNAVFGVPLQTYWIRDLGAGTIIFLCLNNSPNDPTNSKIWKQLVSEYERVWWKKIRIERLRLAVLQGSHWNFLPTFVLEMSKVKFRG